MIRAKLVPLVTLKREKLSIAQIAEQIINFYVKLSLSDADYNQISVVSEKKPLYQSINVNADDAKQQLAEEVLHKNIKEIQKMDKVENPTLDFVMSESIISIGLEVKSQNTSLMTLNFSFQNSNSFRSKIASISVDEVCFDALGKAKFFLDTAKASFSVDYSVIKISDRDLNKVARGYKAPLGWVTYFSNDFEIPIPDDLEGIEYEHTDNGKYLILTRENPIAPETIETNKEKLINLMGEIKERVPEYSR
ncbi:hypothetical protein AB9P05_08655 [Roseivirga sp. BDSF3-8]|uniref:hypothetical protein n=1 Tax=Roseivirga sp. BDSF3-8 TaxID=3241598 RepID=UPI003531AB9E